MTTADYNSDPGLERDLLISRVVDCRASAEDWSALDRLARGDDSVWRELARAQREHALLSGAVLDEVASADSVGLPEHHAASFRLTSRIRAAGAWGGWAAAAAVALAWMGGLPAGGPGQPGAAGNQASVLPFSNASDALNAYLDLGKKDGRVIQQLPGKVLLDDPQPAADGQGYEVIFIRQIVERERVPDLYRFSRDETGGLTAVPVQVRRAVRGSPGPM
ncbi:MAG: hypothetical protein IT436_02100 [Phycisphaerales bacterium]|nr:hypothetical protein [Phycisphaerales bacterium]